MTTVAVLATGGTIDHDFAATQGKPTEPGRVVERLADEISPLIGRDIRVTVKRWGSQSGPALGPVEMVGIARAIEGLVDESGASGVVVTTGTDMLEELAYLLSLVVDPRIPLAVTGAMFRFGEPGFDGARNLIDAVHTVLSGRFKGLGPVVVFAGEVHAASRAGKAAASGAAAFESVGGGRIARVVEGRVFVNSLPAAGHYLGEPPEALPTVDLVWVASGMDAVPIHAAVASDRAGIVLAGSGGGHVPPNLQPAVVEAISSGLSVVMSSRCIDGSTLQSTYGGIGSETELLGLGVVPAGHITPVKARLRLLVGLALGMDPARIFPVDGVGVLPK
jgi:L-asparaginase